ncbi:Ca-activated chloride channel family protein [Candidatus Electrothrix aarhusensis]|uniref:Ca-activated chloride channel family protein n=1 Tax=Candidatus Electrothrix aarhusensis TaxID=1859131 RepID=A0A3S3QLC0_9BACT|nr:Ca-activated chloride channel family protein [Candidatus Electrothrix aarhusensis]
MRITGSSTLILEFVPMSLIPTFADPLWLLIGLIVCLAALLFILLNNLRRKKELEKFAAPKLLTGLTGNVSRSRRGLKNIFFVLGIASLFLALARPQYGERWIEVRRKGIDILIGVDVSKSMLVQDIKPSRLGRAKLAIRDFVAQLEGDRVGLLPFAGTAFLMCPLTTDYEAFNGSLDTLDVSSIPKGGTDIGMAIRQGGKALSSEANHKIFVLVTDGEDLSEDALKAAEEAKKQNMIVYTIGVGTPQGELIPLSEGQVGRFVKDKQGNFITSKLDEETLTTLAETTGGLYVSLGTMGQGFDTIYERKLSLVPEEEHGQRRRKIPIERFPWPLGAAVLLLSLDFLLTGRRSGWGLRLPFVKTAGRRKKRAVLSVSVLVIGAVAGFVPPQARASEGEELFKAGDYAGAESYYHKALEEDNASPALHFNLGGSLYRQQKYDKAAAAFTQALGTDDLSLQARSYYNRGNSQFFLGASAVAKDKEQAQKQWSAAEESFEAALKLDPKDKAASHNLEMVQKKLKQLKEEMQQSEKQCNNPQDGKDGEQDKQDNKQGKQNENQQEQKKDGEKEQSPDQQKPQEGQKNEHDKKDQQDQQEKQGDQGDKSGSAEEKEAGADQEEAKDKAVPKPEKKEDAPTAEDIQKAAAAQEEQQDKKEEKQMSAEDMERRMMGKMTEEEAKNLLNSLKREQGELNFIPQGTGNEEPVDKDW